MKVDTRVVLQDYEGKPITESVYDKVEKKAKDEEITLRKVISTALNSMMPNENQTAEEKGKLFQLTKKLYDSNEPNFTYAEIVLIEEKVGKFYNALVYGRVLEIMGDGKDELVSEQKEAVN